MLNLNLLKVFEYFAAITKETVFSMYTLICTIAIALIYVYQIHNSAMSLAVLGKLAHACEGDLILSSENDMIP